MAQATEARAELLIPTVDAEVVEEVITEITAVMMVTGEISLLVESQQ